MARLLPQKQRHSCYKITIDFVAAMMMIIGSDIN